MTENNEAPKREHWGSRIGLVLAMAGNAVGLGNFLRFPTQACANGGGAFMIPYFTAFLLLGIPLMWVEWGLGRYGGTQGHGTMPGIYQKLVKNRYFKYLGVLGLVVPLFMVIYYNYIESWTLSYSYFSLTGKYAAVEGKDLAEKKVEMGRFLREFQGMPVTVKVPKNLPVEEQNRIVTLTETKDVPETSLYKPDQHGAWNPLDTKKNPSECPYRELSLKGKYFHSNALAYGFFLITFCANFYFLYRGLSAGIEQLGKIGMPVLFSCAIILAFRVMTLGTPEGSAWSVADGYNFLWNPDFSKLGSAAIWLAAAGQIFFTLSVGSGAIQVYASYLSHKDDIVLTGLATASTNEFAEVVLGGSIAIPAAVAFFGPEMTMKIAQGGAFDLGFQSMPMIFSKIGFGWFFGFIWFGLLFIAGITSSVALFSPALAFLKDELKFTHEKACLWLGLGALVLSHGPVLGLANGVVDEMDFWSGTFGLVVFSLIEIIAFNWIYGMDNAWNEMHRGSDMKIPAIYKPIMKWVTPLYILVLLVVWGVQDGWPILLMDRIPMTDRPVIWLTRFVMIAVTAIFLHLIWLRFGRERSESVAIPVVFWGLPMAILVASYPGLLSINTNALLMLTCSWAMVLGLTGYSVYNMMFVPAKKHADFPEEEDFDPKAG